jgi:hypothetical protein
MDGIQNYYEGWEELEIAQDRWIHISWVELFESHIQSGWQQNDSFLTNNLLGSRN